jgi:hypothetical protein
MLTQILRDGEPLFASPFLKKGPGVFGVAFKQVRRELPLETLGPETILRVFFDGEDLRFESTGKILP